MQIHSSTILSLALVMLIEMACAVPLEAQPLSAAALKQSLDQLLASHPAAERAMIALKAVDLQTGATLYDRNGARLFTPASNLKLYTSACALASFPPGHRFVTRLDFSGKVNAGKLRGDLILVGGGDAMFTHQQLAELADRAARALKERECNQIVGSVWVDNSRYASPQKGPGWMWDDDPDYYNMPVTALMVDFNVMTVRLSQRAGSLQAELVPAADVPIQYVRNHDVPTASPHDAPPRVTRRPFNDAIEVHVGHLEQPLEKRLTPHDPAAWIASILVRMLKDRGIACEPADSRRGEPSETATETLVKYEGATIGAAVRHLNQVSENAVAEVLLHEAAIACGVDRPAWPDGARVITAWLTKSAGLDANSFRLVDGSGLSRYNLVSADSSVRLLNFMQSHPRFDVFWDSLPTYAVDVAHAPNQDVPGGAERVHAKGGSMTGVATVSGYLDTLDGRRLAFSLLANGVLGSSGPIHDLRQKVWERLVRYQAD